MTMTDQIFFNVLTLENILVALTREIGDGPCFLYIKFSWIGVLECWETIVKTLKIQTSTLDKFSLMSAFFGLYGLGGQIPSIA